MLIFRSALGLAILSISSAYATTEPAIERILVVGKALNSPSMVAIDPKQPRQPIPAHDGADFLKTIPGFSVTRKGGTDGDVLFRGMAGSRLGILLDGENILGACDMRMDSPTAYIYPELHDNVIVIKGPQAVRYGAGHSAATIVFERDLQRFTEPSYRFHLSTVNASFNRNDQLVDLTLGNSLGYLRLNGSNSSSDNYKDGKGDEVHSSYRRYSSNIALGWTPNDDNRIELAYTHSDGEAAYADRGMDGTKFLRESINLRLESQNISPWLDTIKFHAFANSIDHVMDDQQLRKPGMMGYNNVTRDTYGARFSADFIVSDTVNWLWGIDAQENTHHSRLAPPSAIYAPLLKDATIRQQGLFTEITYQITNNDTFLSGYRLDHWQAEDHRDSIISMMATMPNPTANDKRSKNLHSAFARYEHQLNDIPLMLYTGLGHSERFPDYWELIAKQSETSRSGFNIKSEKNSQLDAGLLYKGKMTELSASVFYSAIDDYIIVDYSHMMKKNGYVDNINARSYGGEFSISHKFNPEWTIDSALSYVRATNKISGKALPQVSPLELRTGISYSTDKWSVGGLMRAVAKQSRYDIDRGTIVGKDLGPSSGFSVFSANASWKITPALLLSTGIDNLFNKNYAEFVSRAGGNGMGGGIPGFIQTTRINEPGRTVWLKLQLTLGNSK